MTRVGGRGVIGSGASVMPVDLTLRRTRHPYEPIRVGSYPDAIAIAPNRRFAYVTDFVSGTLTRIDLATGVALRPIRVGDGPAGIALTPNGATAYITDAGTRALGNTVTPVEVPSGRVLKPIRVGAGPQGIAIAPNGGYAYVADAGGIVPGQVGPIGTTVTPIDLATRRARAPITVGNAPVAIAIAPGGATAYVANLDSESISPIDLRTNRPGAPIAVDGGPLALAIVGSGSGGSAGSTAYVVNGPAGSGAGRLGNNVTPIRLGTGAASRPIRVPRGPQGIAVTPDGTTAWVTSLDADVITPINLATDRRGPPIRVLGGPFAIAITQRSPSAGSRGSTTTTAGHS